MSKRDGGPAYPTLWVHDEGDGGKGFVHEGMTLRDYFAAVWLQGQVAYKGGDCIRTERAAEAYKMADAMIDERDK